VFLFTFDPSEVLTQQRVSTERMNKSFMEIMRKYHPEVAQQLFKMAVISED
jgi:hypothetical protein